MSQILHMPEKLLHGQVCQALVHMQLVRHLTCKQSRLNPARHFTAPASLEETEEASFEESQRCWCVTALVSIGLAGGGIPTYPTISNLVPQFLHNLLYSPPTSHPTTNTCSKVRLQETPHGQEAMPQQFQILVPKDCLPLNGNINNTSKESTVRS